MTAVVERMLGDPDEAEDVVQEALLRGYVGISQLRDASRATGWLCGIAVNVAKMRLRQRAAERRALAGVATRHGRTDDVEERELLRLVEEAVELLPPPQ